MVLILVSFVIWAVVHSLTAGQRPKEWYIRQFGHRAYEGTYRVFYNVFSFTSLALVFYALAISIPDSVLWSVPWPYRLLNYALQIIGLVGLLVSLIQTDIWSFLGLRQLARYMRGDEHPQPPSDFVARGTYAFVRHPLYVSSLIFLWATPVMTLQSLVIRLLFTAYFLIGSIYEERHLTAEFGERYQNYQKLVPSFIPYRLGISSQSPDADSAD